jgi:tetratricopeptide (TPR) repeat protein
MPTPLPGTPEQRYAASVAALNAGDWRGAQHLAMHLLREIPPHGGVYFVAGVAALQLQQMPLAMECLQRATRLSPGRADYLAQLARAFSQARMSTEALRTADQAEALGPTDAMTLDTLGVVYSQGNTYAKAAEMFRRTVASEPQQANFRFNHATSLVFIGALSEAEEELEACLALDPGFWKAHLTLSQLRRQTPDANHVDRLKERLSTAAPDPAAGLYLHLALSKELEDLGDHDQAFEHLVAGKAAGRSTRDYDIRRDEELFAAIRANAPVPGSAGTGFESHEPIFVFGMPRSGTTLVERILSSHPDVQSAGELQNFGVDLKRASGSQTSQVIDVDMLQRARQLDWRQLGMRYIEGTRPLTGAKPRFIDKLTHNFLYAGHIAAALPNARIICLRRDPMDTCLSNFRQLFAMTSPYYDYSFDLLDTGRYYILFDRLMTFWRERLPGRILEVEYEALVEHQEAGTRQLLDFCDLSWDDACLRFEENEAPVGTASAVQVRSKMYRSSMKRWKRYERQLAGLREVLANAGIEVRD